MKTIRKLKKTEAKVQNDLFILNQNKKDLADESFINISNSQIDSTIRTAQLKELREKQSGLINQLNEIYNNNFWILFLELSFELFYLFIVFICKTSKA